MNSLSLLHAFETRPKEFVSPALSKGPVCCSPKDVEGSAVGVVVESASR